MAKQKLSSSFSALALSLAGASTFSAFAEDLDSVGAQPEVEAGTEGSGVVARTRALRGRVLERGTRKPLAGVSVFALPSKLKAVTGDDGRFEIAEVPEGPLSVVVNYAGYQRLEETIDWGSGVDRTFYLERQSYLLYETTVFGRGDKRDESTRSLKTQEFLNVPGAQGDPIKAVQNLPGVNRPSAQAGSQVIIQGAAPAQTKYQIDGHEVPIIFHVGGLSSVVLPEALERVDYLSAGYGPENGRALGGIVGVWTKEPSKDRYHGFGFFDVYNAGFMLEGPAPGPNASFLVGGRQSYIGPILEAVLKDQEGFNLTVAPSFSDLVGVYDAELTAKDKFHFTFFTSSDKLEFLFPQPVGADATLRGKFSNTTDFWRVIPQWTHTFDESLKGKFSIAAGQDFLRLDIFTNFLDLDITSMTTRGELDKRFSDAYATQIGFDHRYTWADAAFKLRSPYSEGGVSNPFASGELQEQAIEGTRFASIGLYWRNEWKSGGGAGPWTLGPSIRGEYYRSTGDVLALPRLAAKYAFDDSFFLRLGSGVYAQSPEEREVDEGFGNPNLETPIAYHLAIAADKDFRGGGTRGLTTTAGFFYRSFDNLVLPDIERNFSSNGDGIAYGGEALIRADFMPFTGSLTYTLSRSTRSENGENENLFQFDQTHLLTAIAAVDLPANWRISTRLRYVTGNPLTPVEGAVLDADNDVFLPIRGPIYSERLSPFFQADLRVDKKWIQDTWILWLYLDLQNVTNRRNVENLQYAYDYSESQSVAGLPFIPSFGIKAEF